MGIGIGIFIITLIIVIILLVIEDDKNVKQINNLQEQLNEQTSDYILHWNKKIIIEVDKSGSFWVYENKLMGLAMIFDPKVFTIQKALKEYGKRRIAERKKRNSLSKDRQA